MKPAYCQKHGVQSFIQTSPRLAEEISGTGSVDDEEIRILQIISSEKTFEYMVDTEFLKGFRLPLEPHTAALKDRDKSVKQLNDRLLVQQVTNEMKWVCPLCLNARRRERAGSSKASIATWF
ncbi:hypothetical protein [Noviherbaspirillum aerium]|uniref:hypothetical protein n=1 Tax=Noviherbaspirillum aerium TaxID=2588497 RepID=UPI00124F5868|nr:hypothetical protein [Noviherbaspirillum aerium]